MGRDGRPGSGLGSTGATKGKGAFHGTLELC
jgi:hypothetical protein